MSDTNIYSVDIYLDEDARFCDPFNDPLKFHNWIITQWYVIDELARLQRDGHVLKTNKGHEYLLETYLELFPKNDSVFVFGSNLAGRHGRGAALFAARYRGARYGIGVGLQGNSYALPTKDEAIEVLPISTIQRYVNEFVEFAIERSDLTFFVTKVGCGLARVQDKIMAKIFERANAFIVPNLILPEVWVNPTTGYDLLSTTLDFDRERYSRNMFDQNVPVTAFVNIVNKTDDRTSEKNCLDLGFDVVRIPVAYEIYGSSQAQALAQNYLQRYRFIL